MSIKKQFAKYVSQNILGTLGVSCYIIADTFFISQAAGANGITVNSEKSVEMGGYAFQGMRLYFTGFLFAGFNMVVSGYLSATEHAVGSFVISILRGVAAIIFFAFVLAYLLGFTGVWLSFVAAEAVTAVVAVACLLYKRK